MFVILQPKILNYNNSGMKVGDVFTGIGKMEVNMRDINIDNSEVW